jgi:ubiquinone biosynthesis protein
VTRRSGAGGRGGWLAAIDAWVEGFEDTTRALREAADQNARSWRRVGDDWRTLAGDLRALGREIRAWPRRSARLAASAGLLGRTVLAYRWQEIEAAFLPADTAQDRLEALHQRTARRLRALGLRQGGGLLKVGQMLSARPDLLPAAWITELATLQDAATPVPFPTIRATVEAELGASLEALFAAFDAEPIGVASIAQVHRARMPDGADVAVKVRRPGVESLLDLDLGLLELFVAGVHSLLPEADWTTISGSVRAAVSAELDFAREALVMDRVADFFAGHPAIRVPRSRPERSSERVLTATFFEGRRIAEALDAWSTARAAGDGRAAERLDTTLGLLLEAYLRQVLEAGVFQADPHPGNFLVTDAGELVILDFGCSQELGAPRRAAYLALFGAVLAGDRAAAAHHLGELGFATRSGRSDSLLELAEALLATFRRMATGVRPWLAPDEVEGELRRLAHAAAADPVVALPDDFVMLGRVFGTLGGLFQHYGPRVDWGRHVAPVLGALTPAAPGGPAGS